MIKIYALINPLTQHVFYIGASKFPEVRYAHHIYDKLSGSFKSDEIRKILLAGEKPELLIIDSCDISKAAFMESFYIDLFSFYGFTLRQSKTTLYPNSASKENREVYKTVMKNDIVRCCLTVTVNGLSCDLRAEIPSSEYNESKTKEFLKKEYRIKHPHNP